MSQSLHSGLSFQLGDVSLVRIDPTRLNMSQPLHSGLSFQLARVNRRVNFRLSKSQSLHSGLSFQQSEQWKKLANRRGKSQSLHSGLSFQLIQVRYFAVMHLTVAIPSFRSLIPTLQRGYLPVNPTCLSQSLHSGLSFQLVSKNHLNELK